MARNDGWVPQQHGAWAMLAVPSLLGLILSLWLPDITVRGVVGRVALIATFFLGYFTFNAVSLWLKTPRRRRARYARPALAYAAATAVLGGVSVWLLGLSLLWWAVPYAPLALAALALVWMRQERSVLSGGLTVAAATLFHAVVVHPGWMADPHLPSAATALWVSLVCFLYFFGTVWTVKTMIRRRGSLWWWLASIGYHVLALAVAAFGWATGALSWGYLLFFSLTIIKAWLLPRIGPMARPPRSITPLTLGLVEIAFSLALTFGVLASTPVGLG